MKTATTYINYQQRASEFAVGDLATPNGANEVNAGRVVAVYPAIGMVDLEFSYGSGRYPVEQLQRVTGIDAKPPVAENDSVPGGTSTARVPGGPSTKINHRVAQAFLKKTLHKNALYWASSDRHYRATKVEMGGGGYYCPKCGETALRPTRYKRIEGKTEHLLACPSCLFLIRKCDIIGHPDYVDDQAPKGLFSGIRLGSSFEEHLAELDDFLADWDGSIMMGQGSDSGQGVIGWRS